VGVGVNGDKGGHVHGQGQAHVRIVQGARWSDPVRVVDAVAGREAVTGGAEHPGPARRRAFLS
jgi:hypothetical protein